MLFTVKNDSIQCIHEKMLQEINIMDNMYFATNDEKMMQHVRITMTQRKPLSFSYQI